VSLLLAALLNLPAVPSVTVNVVPHAEQRYDTAGDWRVEAGGGLVVTVSDLGDHRFNLILAGHELVEALLCQRDGISEQQVDEWDRNHVSADEPGEVEGCPYRTQHSVADQVERWLAYLMGVDWDAYSTSFDQLEGGDEVTSVGV
jgi:hypothetical protein